MYILNNFSSRVMFDYIYKIINDFKDSCPFENQLYIGEAIKPNN